MAEWENSKENIQPLKHGRKVNTLNTVLQFRDEETQKLLNEERAQFETEIRSYAGDDPLDPWYRYISWVEQSYPKGGKKGNIHVLLEKCIKLFKANKEALADPRFLEVWLKYAGMSAQPLDVYNFMFTNGMCTQQAGLYDAWAWHLETQTSYKTAESVYLKGMDALVDPEAKAGLKERKAQFEARVCRRMMGAEIPAEEIEEQEQRSALGGLKGHGKRGKVNSVRIGSAKTGGPGIIPSGPAKQPLKPNNGAAFKIFNDDKIASAVPSGTKRVNHGSVPSRDDYKENQMAAGKWTGSRGPKAVNIPFDEISRHAKPTFAVHEDHESGHSTITPHKLAPGESNVLSARKQDHDDGGIQCPIALFEPPDPTKRPMYCKNLVYQGATEFSFEELRAVKWRASEKCRRETEELAEKRRRENDEIEEKRLALLEMERKLEEKQQIVAKQMEDFQMMLRQQQTKPDIMLTRPSLVDSSNNSSTSETRSSDNSYNKKNSTDDTSALINANASGVRTRKAITPNQQRLHSSHPSPTVNTKEALAVMQQLWSTESENDYVFLDNGPKEQASNFEMFSDSGEAGVQLHAAGGQFQIFTDPTENLPPPSKPSAPFAIFTDNQVIDKENIAPSTMHKSKGLSLHPKKTENAGNEVSDDENMPPPGYVQTTNTRPTDGVLVEARNVEWMPLADQEKLLDEDERRQEKALSIPKPKMGNNNATMFVPDESEFDDMARLSSTPFTGRGFIPCDDENTCAVQLVYRDENDDSRAMPPPAADHQTTVFNDPPSSTPPSLTPLYTIVETSREFNRSSSSSSGTDTTHGTTRGDHSKSHWGNTGVSVFQHGTVDSTGFGHSLGIRTPGTGLAVGSSGYMGDKSSMTASNIKLPRQQDRESQGAIPFGQLMEGIASGQDEDQTGMFSDMLAEFKETLQKPDESMSTVHQEKSMHPSFLEDRDRMEPTEENSVLHHSAMPTRTEASHLHMTQLRIREENVTGVHAAPSLNLTGAQAVPSLNFTAFSLNQTNTQNVAPSLNMTGALAAPSLDVTGFQPTPSLDLTGAQSVPSLNLTGAHAAPSLNLTGAQAAPSLNLTGAQAAQSLNLTGPQAVPSLNLTGAQAVPSLNLTGAQAAPSLNLTGAHVIPSLDLTGSHAAPSLNATEAQAALSLNLTTAPENDAKENSEAEINDINPFSLSTQSSLLSSLAVPVDQRHGFVRINRKLPSVSPRSRIELAEDTFVVRALKGEGGFAKVFSAVREDNDMNCTIAGIDAVLKVQKPANEWEWYMCTEVKDRIRSSTFSHLNQAFMSIPRNYSFNDGGIFVSYHQERGTLLDVANKLSTRKEFPEPAAMYYMIEVLAIMEALHSVHIIHADLKTDNFLIKDVPKINIDASTPEEMFNLSSTSLQLIDFGRAIDLSILPAGVSFSQIVKTDGLKCVEMREGRRWRHHIDFYGIAAIAYTLLFGTYMDVVKHKGVWEVKGSFKRFWKSTELWKAMFGEFLNIQDLSQNSLPDLRAWRLRLMQEFWDTKMARSINHATAFIFKPN